MPTESVIQIIANIFGIFLGIVGFVEIARRVLKQRIKLESRRGETSPKKKPLLIRYLLWFFALIERTVYCVPVLRRLTPRYWAEEDWFRRIRRELITPFNGLLYESSFKDSNSIVIEVRRVYSLDHSQGVLLEVFHGSNLHIVSCNDVMPINSMDPNTDLLIEYQEWRKQK